MHSSRAILLQQYGPYRWEGQYNDDWLVHKCVVVNEYRVKAQTGDDSIWLGRRSIPRVNVNTTAPAVSRAAELGQVTILFGLKGDQLPV